MSLLILFAMLLLEIPSWELIKCWSTDGFSQVTLSQTKPPIAQQRKYNKDQRLTNLYHPQRQSA